jgi:ABC-type nitrate/sulfonate/bicarbonate transport system substrate-binding protein
MERLVLNKLILLRRSIVLLADFSIFATVSLHAEPVRISYSAISWLMTPVWMAEELGLFKKYNLEAQLIYIPSSATSVQTLLGAALT